MLIEHSTPKVPAHNSAYYRMTGNELLAQLLQKVHSCSIRNGNELENLSFEHSKNKNKIKDYKFNGTNWIQPAPGETNLVLKFMVKKGLFSKKGTHVDFALLTSKDVYLVELKDGCNFDTKKSTGEYEKISKVKDYLEKNDPFQRTYHKYIVSWNATKIEEISFKDERAKNENMLMVGKDFAELIDVDYNKVNQLRNGDRIQNEEYVLTEVVKIAIARGIKV